MSRQLPPQQSKILAYFADAEDSGHQPSRAEVAEAFGYAFPSAVSKHVEALVRKGLLAADREKKRNVRLTETGWAAINRSPGRQGVPVIGAIAAGVPILASEQHAGYLKDIQPSPGRFALQVRGDSMIDDGILDGDYAVIQAEGKVADNQVAAVVVDGEATLKRVRYYPDRIELIAANPKYQPRIVSKATANEVQIVGPLCFVYRTIV
ncbi:MAG: repressor LexA [Planctomycetes bacterium]|nr:repressor LexA [Planctomycetota bacterium]